MRWRRLFTVLVVIVLTSVSALYAVARLELIPARHNPLLPLDLNDAPGPVMRFKLWRIAGETESCVTALRKAGAIVEASPDFIDPRTSSCNRLGSVVVSKLSAASLRPEEMRCDLALRLYLLERHVIQPAARRQLGSSVAALSHFGSYSCRTIRGSRRRMSEHSTANAFDLSGFRLANGRMVTLKADWRRGGAPASFLREVRAGACRFFAMTLSPDYNADHADHFHVDMGLFRGCH